MSKYLITVIVGEILRSLLSLSWCRWLWNLTFFCGVWLEQSDYCQKVFCFTVLFLSCIFDEKEQSVLEFFFFFFFVQKISQQFWVLYPLLKTMLPTQSPMAASPVL